MPKTILTIIFIFLFIGGVSAQYHTNQNKVWAFGFGGGVDFTSGVPVPFVSSMASNEGCASVSDA
jgi:hypothetical protein